MNTIAPIIGINRHKLLTDGEGVTTLVAFHGCPLAVNIVLIHSVGHQMALKSY